jgi:amylosucrase
VWAGILRLARARRTTRAVHAQGVAEPVWTGNEHVFGLCREHAGARLLVLANFTAAPQPLNLAPVHERGLTLAPEAAEADGRPLAVDGDFLVLAPYQHIWVLD